MLKVLMASVLISLFSSSSFAENCTVSDALKNKSCSTEYFRARSERELDDYLLNGKFKDGKLLNLEIGFNVKEKEINIATSCDLKISRERGLFAKQNGICLKGSSVRLEGENELIADKNAPINISAVSSVIIRRSSLETKGDLSISTSSFLPLDGEVLLSRESILKARNIHINSKSNLIINSESKLKADSMILDGGNCEINEKNDRDNDDDREHARECRKFKPQFTYSGTCTSNPLPTSLKITSTVNSNNSQSINFSVSGAPSASTLNWKFDQVFESNDAIAKQDFMYPGKHLAQAVVIGSSGYFRKIGQFLNVSPAKFNKGQIAIFQFIGSQSAPRKIQAAIDMRNVTLTKSEQYPELYFAEIVGEKAGVKNIFIPYFKYQGQFSFKVLPTISNQDEYISTKIDELLTIPDDSPLTDGESHFYEIFGAVTTALKNQINALSSTDKSKLADLIQANITAETETLTTSNFNNKSDFSNFVISSAHAQSTPTAQEYDLATVENMKRYRDANIRIVKRGVVQLATGILLTQLPSPTLIEKIVAAALILSGIHNIAKEYSIMVRIIDWIYKITDDFRAEINSMVVSNTQTSLKLFGDFVAINEELDRSKSTLIGSMISANGEYNKVFDSINSNVNTINKILSWLGFDNPFSTYPSLTFKNKSFSSILNTNFTSVRLVGSEFGDVALSVVGKTTREFNLLFQAQRSQNATIEVIYRNDELGANIVKQIPVKISVTPKAVINYTKSNLLVSFDSTGNSDVTGLTYAWDFADTQTSALQAPSHTYSQAGTYTVSLTVTDVFGTTATANTSVTVGGATYTLVIPPMSYTAEFVDFFGDGTNWMHENFIYSTVNNISSGQFYFAPFDAPTDMKIKMTFSLNGSPNDYYYPGQAYFEFVGKNCKVSPNATVSYSPDQDLYYWNGIINGPGPVTITVECDSINFGLLGYNGIDFSIPPTITFEHMKNSL